MRTIHIQAVLARGARGGDNTGKRYAHDTSANVAGLRASDGMGGPCLGEILASAFPALEGLPEHDNAVVQLGRALRKLLAAEALPACVAHLDQGELVGDLLVDGAQGSAARARRKRTREGSSFPGCRTKGASACSAALGLKRNEQLRVCAHDYTWQGANRKRPPSTRRSACLNHSPRLRPLHGTQSRALGARSGQTSASLSRRPTVMTPLPSPATAPRHSNTADRSCLCLRVCLTYSAQAVKADARRWPS